MAAVTTRQGLKEYCLRRLGAPVMQINVDDAQLEDRIDDAIVMYWTYHGDGTQRNFYAHVVTSADISNKYIQLSDDIITVVKLLPFNASSYATTNIEFQYYMTELINIAKTSNASVGNFMISQQYLNTVNEVFNREEMIRFNSNNNRVYIDHDWTSLTEGTILIFECYARINPEEFGNVYNSQWLKDYTTSLFKKQWGMNLIKYDGFQLPSGIVLNGRQLYDDAVNEITALEDQLNNTWQLPIDMLIG